MRSKITKRILENISENTHKEVSDIVSNMAGKVSFDFDSTLTRPSVQKYAKELVQRGVEVWICTSRWSPEKAPNKEWNDDLFAISDKVGIKREHIIFTNYADKSEFLKDKRFLWHLDDDNIELDFIKQETNVKGVLVWGNDNWKNECENEILKNT